MQYRKFFVIQENVEMSQVAGWTGQNMRRVWPLPRAGKCWVAIGVECVTRLRARETRTSGSVG